MVYTLLMVLSVISKGCLQLASEHTLSAMTLECSATASACFCTKLPSVGSTRLGYQPEIKRMLSFFPFCIEDQFSFLVFKRMELPITMTSEKAMVSAPIVGLKRPAAATGMATTL